MLNVSPVTAGVVSGVTVRIGVADTVFAIISVLCPRNAGVVVSSLNVIKRPLNWSATDPAGVSEEVIMLVVVEPTPTVPTTLPFTACLNAASAEVELPMADTLLSRRPSTRAAGRRLCMSPVLTWMVVVSALTPATSAACDSPAGAPRRAYASPVCLVLPI